MDMKEWEARELIRAHAEWIERSAWDTLTTVKQMREHTERIYILLSNTEQYESEDD